VTGIRVAKRRRKAGTVGAGNKHASCVTSVRRKTSRSSSPGRKKVGFRAKGRGWVEENLGFFSSPFTAEIFGGQEGKGGAWKKGSRLV
jgi:hypothetical protein